MIKKIITCLTLLLTCKIALADNSFNCEIEDSGEVNLTYIYSQVINQKLKAFVGLEKWSKPFAIKEKCEILKYELINTPEERWGNYECENYGTATSVKFITYKLTEKGKNILDRPGWDVVQFIPTRPLMPYFVSTVEDVGCDPY